MREERKRANNNWLVRISVTAGAVNAIATAITPLFNAPAAWSSVFSVAGICALSLAVAVQRHSLKHHQPLVDEKNARLSELTKQLDSAQAQLTKQSDQLDRERAKLLQLEAELKGCNRLRSALPILLEVTTELRTYLTPTAIRSCLKGQFQDFVSAGVAGILTSLRSGLRALTQNGDHVITCALHIGDKRISSAYAAGTTPHRKQIERNYVRSSHSLSGLVRRFPMYLAGSSLEDEPPRHDSETHSAAGFEGNIYQHIQSYLCKPIVTFDDKEEKTIGVLQVDSSIRAAFPAGTNVLVKPAADAIGVLFQIGALADQIQRQNDPLLNALRNLDT